MASDPAEHVLRPMPASGEPTRDHEPAGTEPKRLSWPDYAKGMAIILVVICHVSEGASFGRPAAPSVIWRNFIAISYAFMVPVFFAVAGWFSERTIQRHGPGYQLRSVARNILYPYLLWSVLQTALMIISRAGNRVPAWSDLTWFLLSGSMQFWFFHALIISYVLDVLARAAGLGVSLRLMLSAILLAVFSIFPNAAPPVVQHPATHFAYFVGGSFCFSYGLRLRRPGSIAAAGMCGLAALLTLHFINAACDTPFRPFAAVAGMVACFSLSALLPGTPWLSWLKLAGQHSLSIFCLHVIFAAGTRLMLFKAGINDFAIHIVAGSFAGLLVPALLSIASAGRFDWLFRIPPGRKT